LFGEWGRKRTTAEKKEGFLAALGMTILKKWKETARMGKNGRSLASLRDDTLKNKKPGAKQETGGPPLRFWMTA
jgi:hypothetical protein